MARRMIFDRKQANKPEPFLINIGSQLSLAVNKCFPERQTASERKKTQT